MANAAITYLNLADAGTLSASTAAVSMPITYLQNVHVARRWRSTSNSAYFVLDFGASVSIDTLALLGMTMGATGTIRWRLSTVDANGAAGDAYDSVTPAVVDGDYDCHIVALPAPVTCRYLRVDLSDASGTYVEAGRLFAGLRTAFTYNFAYGWQRAWIDRSIVQETRGGQSQVWNDNSYRTIDLNFEWVTQTQRNGIVEQIDIVCGRSSDLLFMTDTDSTNMARDSIFGLMTEATPVSQPFFDMYSKSYKIKERL